ncbi:hypothetical protein NDU88_006834 [Pleurodeles waltl]|uniref:Uncharacterized protein n=1 Tax=Pleurodeles waltl TaxID=8319 RepID=A0AAV7TZN5_PLEWA|nr:hypothetical protein NDU88_006834 [Pleurodeles waltl]
MRDILGSREGWASRGLREAAVFSRDFSREARAYGRDRTPTDWGTPLKGGPVPAHLCFLWTCILLAR